MFISATYYFQEGATGACGIVHKDTDHVVALQTEQYANGVQCGRTITITDNTTGKTATGIVADLCPGCNGSGSIDLSESLFEVFAPTSQGVFPVSWNFNAQSRIPSSSIVFVAWLCGVKPELHPHTRGTGLFGVAWDKLLPLLFAFCFYISVCMGPKGYCSGNGPVYFPPSRRPKLPRSLTQLRIPNSPLKRESFYVVFRGVGSRDVSLRLFPTDTVGRIYTELRLIRVIPRHNTFIEPMVYYDAFQSSPLKCETTMQQLGIGELSVLHVRYQLLGGTGGSIWDVLGSQAQRARNSNSAGPAVPSHFPSINLDRILGALLNGLQAASTYQQGSSTGGWEVEDTSHIDWEGQGMDYDAVMGRSQDEQRLDEIEAQLKEYMLDDGAFEMDSDVEDSLVRITARKLLVDPKRTKFDIAAEALVSHVNIISFEWQPDNITLYRKHLEENAVLYHIDYIYKNPAFREIFMTEVRTKCSESRTALKNIGEESLCHYIQETREMLDPVKRKALSLPAKDTDTQEENFFQGYAQWLRWIVYDEDPPPK
ncbi:hypothetical protein M422DRAFT_249778 [Sphaerobolus stellatus SS14]|uniref:Uncharacterized protein n=1 Tax=Sphaerobolus stellatus (strain SS14) TaxID=990650 RepID=A0A0C9W4S9_SPHS4|nr:hypothetical protein M422DRAFT_249778 [Sphaerobolus stellatus SS14]